MRYEEKVTYRTTPSGGQEVITESVPVYSKREQRAMDRHNRRLEKRKGSGKGERGSKKKRGGMLFRLFLFNPWILIILIGIIIIFLVYMVMSADSELTQLITTYQSLSAKPTDSKIGFDKRLFFVTVNEDGTVSVTIGAKSEEQLAEAEAEAEEAIDNATVGSIPDFTNSEIYNKLASNPKYAGKASSLAACWETFKPLYGEEFAVGQMANILAEGSPGKIEGINYASAFTNGSINISRKRVLSCGCSKSGTATIDYWAQAPCEAHEIANKFIKDKGMVEALLKIPSGVQGIGVGVAQWSGSRREALLQLYKSKANTFSEEELLLIEMEQMKNEYASGYSGVVGACSGKTASECAYTISTKYEAPGVGDQATKRATIADDLWGVLSNV